MLQVKALHAIIGIFKQGKGGTEHVKAQNSFKNVLE